jgi:hypothetical protein
VRRKCSQYETTLQSGDWLEFRCICEIRCLFWMGRGPAKSHEKRVERDTGQWQGDAVRSWVQ